MDEHEENCECAPCGTLVMGPFEGWEPRWLPDGVEGTCVFCRQYVQLGYYTALGMSVGRCCARREK
ncbi:hypothetical protein ACFRCI_23675 [Streptomyces sp. NPDC056638]|uniref:hypothetical protein n=1 Tax=Streptomyces sp. NPDC056638 TaxID=3345887 RepID=UPI0036B986A0